MIIVSFVGFDDGVNLPPSWRHELEEDKAIIKLKNIVIVPVIGQIKITASLRPSPVMFVVWGGVAMIYRERELSDERTFYFTQPCLAANDELDLPYLYNIKNG